MKYHNERRAALLTAILALTILLYSLILPASASAFSAVRTAPHHPHFHKAIAFEAENGKVTDSDGIIGNSLHGADADPRLHRHHHAAHSMHDMKNGVERMARDAADMADKAAKGAKDAADSVMDSAKNAADRAKDGVKDAADHATDGTLPGQTNAGNSESKDGSVIGWVIAALIALAIVLIVLIMLPKKNKNRR